MHNLANYILFRESRIGKNNSSMKPEVSVIIPTYNSENYLAKALKSVFDQSYSNFEIILIDDASSDRTVRIAKGFRDRRLKIFQNDRNRGVSYGRNLGIKQAKGKWIALLDSDDWYAPQRLEKLVAAGTAYNADLIADDLWLIGEATGQHWSTLITESIRIQQAPITLIDAVTFVESDRLPAIKAKRNWSLGYTKPLIKREFLLSNQIWYDENLRVGEDFTLYLQCLRKQAQFYLLGQPYYYYRTREGSLSTRKPIEYLTESCTITESFIDYEVTSPEESCLLKALIGNLTIFQKRLAFYRLIEIIKQKKLRTAIAHTFQNPFVIGDLVQKSSMVLARKVKALVSRESIPTSRTRTIYSSLRPRLQDLN